MRNTISNLLTPKGRWLPTLLLLFTLGIGQMWAADTYYVVCNKVKLPLTGGMSGATAQLLKLDGTTLSATTDFSIETTGSEGFYYNSTTATYASFTTTSNYGTSSGSNRTMSGFKLGASKTLTIKLGKTSYSKLDVIYACGSQDKKSITIAGTDYETNDKNNHKASITSGVTGDIVITNSSNKDYYVFAILTKSTGSSCGATANAGADKATTAEVGVAMAATAAAEGYTGVWSIKAGSQSTDASQLGTTSSNTMTFTPSAAGTYTLVWTVTSNSDNTCFASDEATVTASAPKVYHSITPNIASSNYESYTIYQLFKDKSTVNTDYTEWVSGSLNSAGNTWSTPSGLTRFVNDGEKDWKLNKDNSIEFDVTNCISVAILYKSGSTSRYVSLSVKNDGVEVGTVASGNTNSITQLAYGTTLDATKKYVITVTNNSSDNSYIEAISFEAPAATYTVTFDNNGHGGTAPDAQSGITSGGKATEPTEPEDASYNFGGWYNMEDWADPSAEKWNFGTSTVTKDTTLYAKWTDKSVPSTDATLSALSVAGCTFNETFDPATLAYTVDLPFYASMPVVGDVTATKNDANAKTPVVSVEGNVITVACEAEDGTTKINYTITVTIAATPTASSSINIEQAVLDYGTSYNIGAALDAAHIAYVSKDALDSLKNQEDRNEPFLGLKFKATDSKVTIIVPSNQSLKVKFGSISGDANLRVSVNGSTAAAPSLTSGVYTLAASDGVKEVIFSQTGNKKTVVYKQIKINADIDAVQLPWLVTYDAGEHGTCATAKETWTGTALTLPAATPEDGWSFDGWKDDENNDATSPYTPTKDVVLTAQYTALASPFDLTALTYQIGTAAAQNVGYTDGVFTYNIELPYANYDAITVAPTLKVGTSSIKEGAVLTVSSLPGAATFTVVEAGGANEKQYTVNFTKAPKDGICLIKANVGNNTFVIDETASLLSGTAEKNNVKSESEVYEGKTGWKFNSKGAYLGLTLPGTETFQANDVVKVFITKLAGDAVNTKVYVYTDKTTADLNSVLLASSVADQAKGENTIILPSTTTNKIYLCRGADTKDYQDWNPYVAYVAVYRAMNPVLKSIQFNSTDVAVSSTSVSATLPYGTNLGSMTVTPEIVWNGAAAENSILINGSATGAWAWGENTYKLTDKDGDATTYTITLTEADHYEAQIGSTQYTTLVAAVAAASEDDVVELLDNVDLMATGLTIAENMTLDLNGFNIKAGEQIDNDIFVPAGKKLTLVDNSEGAHGKIYTEQAYTGAVTGYGLIRVAGELLMQSGNIYAVIESDPANLGQFAVVVAPAGKVTVAGGQIKAGWYAISNSGNNTGSTIIVSGGELISTADFAIYNPAKESTVTVSGGVVYGAAGGIAMNRGELTVTGGTITSKDQGTTGTWGDGTGGMSNAAIAASGKYESVEVEISGGTIIAEGTAVMITNGTTNPVEVAISGGQFSHVVPAEYCAEGFAPVTEPNAQSKYEVEDKRIYIFNGSTMSDMAESPSAGAITWAKVGSTMGAENKNCTYDEVSYTKALQIKGSSATKHFRIDVAENNNAKIEVIGMSNSSDETRHTWLTNSTTPGTYAEAIAGLETAGYTPAYFATDWLEEGSYYLHADNSVNLFLIRVTPKAVPAKCEIPTITAQPATDLTFGAGNMTATVEAEVSDGGTLTYQWYNADGDVAVAGQTTATLTTAVEGTYYVIVTNTLDNHRDNSIKSAEAQLAHRVMNDATLSALSASEGTLDPTFDKDVEEYRVDLPEGTVDVPTLSATATMDGYANVAINNATAFVNYEATSTVVVTSEDGTANKTYTVKFYVDHLLPQVDVTESTTWDWTYAAEGTVTIKVTDSTEPIKKNEEGLMANVRVDDNKPTNDATFNSQALLFYGENVRAKDGGRWYASLGHIKFNVTVPGKVTVEFSDNGTNNRRLKINDQMSESSSSKTDVKTFAAYVEAGEVTLMGVEEDGTGSNKYIRISKIEFTAADESRANLQLGGIGTVCLPFDVATTDRFGGTFYKADYQGPGFAYFLEETGTLEAGKPYVYVADTTFIVLFNTTGTTISAPETDGNVTRGMYGTFTNMAAGSLTDKYVIAQKKLRRCGTGATLAAYRAYIDLNEMPDTPLEENDPANAPVRRRLGIGGNNGSTTDLQNYFEFDAEGTQKVIMNGQLYILRDGKMYNAQGQLMK